MPAFQHITSDDLKSPMALHLARELEARLQELRRLNDDQPDDIATAKIRGRIAEIRRWQEMLNPVQAKAPALRGGFDLERGIGY